MPPTSSPPGRRGWSQGRCTRELASRSRDGGCHRAFEACGAHLRLPDAHAQPLRCEAPLELVGDRGRERLEQRVLPLVRDLLHGARDRDVVDRVLEPVAHPALPHLELDVEDEVLAALALLLVHAVAPEDAQVADLDDDHAIAPATVRASTWGLTSWTRRIVAPCWNAATAAA